MEKSTPVWSANQLRNARYFQRFHHAKPHKTNRDKITDQHLAAAASIQPDYRFYTPDEEDWPKKWEEDDGTHLKRILRHSSWKQVVAHFEATKIVRAHFEATENVRDGEQESEVNKPPVGSEHSGPASEHIEAADRDNQNMTVTGSPDTTNAPGDDDGRASRIHEGRSAMKYPTIRTVDHEADNVAIARDMPYDFNANGASPSNQLLTLGFDPRGRRNNNQDPSASEPSTLGFAPHSSAKYNPKRWIRDSFSPELATWNFAAQGSRNEYPYPQSLVPKPLSINKSSSASQASQANTQTTKDVQESPETRRRFMRWWSSLTKERRSYILQDLERR